MAKLEDERMDMNCNDKEMSNKGLRALDSGCDKKEES